MHSDRAQILEREVVSRPQRLSRAILPTPLGDMLALSSDDGLCALEFTEVHARGWRSA